MPGRAKTLRRDARRLSRRAAASARSQEERVTLRRCVRARKRRDVTLGRRRTPDATGRQDEEDLTGATGGGGRYRRGGGGRYRYRIQETGGQARRHA